MPQGDSDPRVGTTIAGYRLGERLGRGGMGVVYRAEHLRLGRPAAVKVVLPELAADPAFRERFAREARIAATLQHRHVVMVYDAGEADGVLYLAMQLVQGGDLAERLAEQGALDPVRALAICGQVAGALDASHAVGLIHRDVKPANVLLDGDTGYLTDFGLVKLGPSTTRTHDIVGTIQYAAPEQIEGGELTGRADQYALAAVLHHCLCGAPPFVGDSDVAVMYGHLRDTPPAPSALRPGLPAALDGVLARGLEKAPRRRFESCAALISAAREALGDVTGAEVAAPRIVPAEGDDPSVETLTDLPRLEPGAGRRTRVLLAGVDAQTRALTRVAVGGGCEVHEVEDAGALPAAARERPPDVVVLAWDAPGPGAAETLAALREDPVTRDLKVVLAVDWRSAGRADVRVAGADATIETPFSPLQLQVKLRRLLGTDALIG
jgi:serine/threonine-protein kinase